jgi:hypothetical protein
MKKLLLSIPVLFLIFFGSCKPSVKEALAYNDTIVYYHQEIDKKLAYLSDTYGNYVPNEMDSAYKTAKSTTQIGIDFISSFKDFHGDDSYRKAALELFQTYKSVLEVEHVRIIELLKLPTNEFQQPQIDELDKLKETARKKIDAKIDEVAKVQEEFAKKFNYQFKEKEDL